MFTLIYYKIAIMFTLISYHNDTTSPLILNDSGTIKIMPCEPQVRLEATSAFSGW